MICVFDQASPGQRSDQELNYQIFFLVGIDEFFSNSIQMYFSHT